MDLTISLETVVVAATDQLSCRLDEDTVLLDLKEGTYYGLNEVGTVIWGLIQQPQSVQAVYSAVLGQYEVDPETCKRDVLRVLEDLRRAGLVELRPTA